MITRTIPFIFESDAKTALRNGSQFSVQFGENVQIPREAQEIFVQVSTAEIWNTFPNIEVGVNNLFVFSFLGNQYTLSVPTGAFTTEALNFIFGPQLLALNFEGLVTFGESVEQSRVIMTFDRAGVTYLSGLSTLSSVIGFTTDVTSTLNTLQFLGDSIAAFNVVNKLLLHTNLPVNGIISNGLSTNVIAKIPITETPGLQFIYAPFYPARVPAPSLAGFTIRDITFWITDERGRPVNTLGENYGFSLDIIYEERRRFHQS
jgi:hypothetical protein